MKLTKKILLATAAILTVGLIFSGCKEEEGESGDVGKDFVLQNTSSDQYLRGWTSVATKHTSATAKITIKDTEKYLSSGANGVVGFIFGLQDAVEIDASGKKTKNKLGGKTFGIVGIRRKSSTTADCYVSWFENAIVPTGSGLMSPYKTTSGKTVSFPTAATNGTVADPITDSEIEVTKGFQNLPNPVEGESLVVWVKLEATGGAEGEVVKAGKGDGGYKVTFYNNTVNNKGKDEMGSLISGMSYTIPSDITHDEKATQYDLGLYTNVYGGTPEDPTKLEGRIDLSSYVNDVEVELVFED